MSLSRPTVLAFLFCLALGTRAAQGVERLTTYLPAEPSPLAAQSLVLDVTTAGTRLVAVGVFGHVLLSDNGGASWRQAESVPTQATLTAVTFIDERRGWAVGHDAVIIHTEDGGLTWSLQYSDLDFGHPLLTVLFLDEARGLAMGALGLALETRNGGRRWQVRSLRPGDVVDLNLNKIVAQGGALFVASEFGTVYRSTDGGASFSAIQSPSTVTLLNALALPDGTLLFMGANGAVWRTGASLQSWLPLTSPKGARFIGGTALPGGRFLLVGAMMDTSQEGVLAFGELSGRALAVHKRPGEGRYTAAAWTAPGAIVLAGQEGLRVISDRP